MSPTGICPASAGKRFVIGITTPSMTGKAKMGLVSLHGMMNGQLLGGGEPWLAVKYQIAIMLCIYTRTTLEHP